MTKFIAITSAKGGVGKTSTAINLGTALTLFGKDVVVLDANIDTPHVALHLGAPQLKYYLNDALNGKMHISETAYAHPSGLKIIPSSSSITRAQETSLKGISNVLLDLAGTVDLVLVDVSSGIGVNSKLAIAACDKMIIITNPEIPSISDALKTIRLAEETGCEVLGTILNRHTGEQFEIEPKNVEALLDIPVIGIIPEDQTMKKAIALKHPVVYTHPNTPASIAFKKIAAQMLGQEYMDTLNKK